MKRKLISPFVHSCYLNLEILYHVKGIFMDVSLAFQKAPSLSFITNWTSVRIADKSESIDDELISIHIAKFITFREMR